MARKKHHEEHADESWLIPYADLMTLLLALFIVLFASSSVDAEKYQAIREAFAIEFTGSAGALSDIGSGFLPGIPSPGDNSEDETPSPSPSPSPPSEDGIGEPDPELMGLFEALANYVSANDLGNNMALSLSNDGVLITLSSDVWFDSGSAALTPQMQSFAATLSELLVEKQQSRGTLNIIITGHTDNRPISTAAFRSNWHLSVSRAVNFMENMLRNPGFDPRFFSARGYGEYDPIATNDTDQGRQRNRRVEVLVSLANSDAAFS